MICASHRRAAMQMARHRRLWRSGLYPQRSCIHSAIRNSLRTSCAARPVTLPDIDKARSRPLEFSNCIPESQIILHTRRFDALLENCVFYILRMYEFLHSQGQKRTITQRAMLSALPPKANIRFQSSINNTVDSLIGFSRRSRGRLVRPAAYEETASSTTS